MTKELFVSSTPHETKTAILEDDQLAEVYFERENEYTLAGSIYKGRVTRVLPGMQSAFVDIGLERDAFLYVSDFLELQDEEGEIQEISVSHPQPEAPPQMEAPSGTVPPVGPVHSVQEEAPAQPQASVEAPVSQEDEQAKGWRGRRRRRGRRGRGLPETKFTHTAETPAPKMERSREPAYQPIILPGESISKYRQLSRLAQEQGPPPAPPVAGSENLQNTDSQPHSRETDLSSGEPFTDLTLSAAAEPRHRAHVAIEENSVEQGHPDPEGDTNRYEQMNAAAAALGDTAADQSREPAAEISELLPYQESHTRDHDQHTSGAARAGTLEEEEIEEDESELPSLAEELDDAHFEELEEETHEAGEYDRPDSQHNHISNGIDLIDAVEEEAAQREALAEQYESETGGSEASEGSNVELAETAPGNREIEARAEVRAPAGTAGYQQRTERPAWDRSRGRRFAGRFRRREPQRTLPPISDLLKEGQEILVQIAKEPLGKKGARITSHIALPGRFLVYMPTVNHIGVSRKIASDEIRQRLKRIVMSERENGHGGFIVRTAAGAASEEELRADIRFLKNLWTEIRLRAENSKPPALIYHDLNLVERILRDQVTQDFSQIWVDNEQEYERVLRFVSRFQPALTKRIKLYTKSTPLFEQFNLQEEINKALKSKVWLKSGGYIVINQTEALVAIDVNTGKYVGKTTRLEDTIVKTNVDAIKEIVRQIRLRDLGGIIVIDFIDMDERRNRQKVMQALEEALRSDRAPSKVLQFNDFGLVAITRKRVKQSLERTLGSTCSYCTGSGFVKSVTTICNEIYTELRKIAKELEGSDVMLRVHPEVGKELKANGGRWLQDMEELTGRTIIVKADPTLHQEKFDID
jgi:ribonuclease G